MLGTVKARGVVLLLAVSDFLHEDMIIVPALITLASRINIPVLVFIETEFLPALLLF